VGTVRRHPFLSLLLGLMLSPLVVLGGIWVAQHRPSCSQWRAEVEEVTELRMATRYAGDGNAQEFDHAYRHWDTTFRETRDGVRAQVAHDLSDDRPDLCL
jgi:hypothetical protein